MYGYLGLQLLSATKQFTFLLIDKHAGSVNKTKYFCYYKKSKEVNIISLIVVKVHLWMNLYMHLKIFNAVSKPMLLKILFQLNSDVIRKTQL